ncbi:MAG: glutamine-hydrolyzing GMP synthase, partial [Acidimicrobiales bacterium]
MGSSLFGTAGSDKRILVVDFGAQYAQLIARRVRESNVYSEIVSHELDAESFADLKPSGIIFSGGPMSVNVEGAPKIDPAIYGLGVPILGICYGAQLMAEQNGGSVEGNEKGEYGRTVVNVNESGILLSDFETSTQQVWMSHFDSITSPPEGATVTASSDGSPVAVFEEPKKGLFGVQFHPEVHHTPCGQDLLRRFIHDVCGCPNDWNMVSVVESSVTRIKEIVGDKKAICGLSGGVDSAVAAALVHKAIGDQLTCVFVDTGLMRAGEAQQVVDTFESSQGIELIHIQAAERFFEQLKGVVDPE